MLIKEYEIAENYTDEEEKDFRKFLKKNINKKSTKWLGVEVYENSIYMLNSILLLRKIFSIISDYKMKMNVVITFALKETNEDTTLSKMKLKLFDKEPSINSSIT